MVVASDSKWNLDTQPYFQTQVPREKETKMRRLHAAFNTEHSVSLDSNMPVFSYVQDEQNDPRYFVKGHTSYIQPKPANPLRTTVGWTVDCFLARFSNFEIFAKRYSFVSYPKLIRRFEVQLEGELLT